MLTNSCLSLLTSYTYRHVYVGADSVFFGEKILNGCTHTCTHNYTWSPHLQPMSFSASDFCCCFLWKAFPHGCQLLSCLSQMAIPYLFLFPFLPLAPSGCVCLSVRLAFSGMIRGAVRNVPHYAIPALVVVATSVTPAGKVFTSEKEPIHASIHALRATIWTLVSYHFLSTFLLNSVSMELPKVSKENIMHDSVLYPISVYFFLPLQTSDS